MIARYLKVPGITQCSLANGYLAGSGYCMDACKNSESCNFPCRQEDIVAEYAKAGISSNSVPFAIDLKALSMEITAGRPVLAMIDYNNNASHVVLLTGYSADASVYVVDTRPGYGEGWVDYMVLRQAHGYGAWTASWTQIT
jgi:hypothetical protein